MIKWLQSVFEARRNMTFQYRCSNFFIERLIKLEYEIMANLDDIKAQVAANSEVVESAIILLKGLKEKLDACGTDQAAINDLKATLETETSRLAEAVAMNTPQQ